jgi:RHS repeat-associated protein
VTNYGYDDLGALLTATDPDSALTMTYDNLGRLRTVDNVGTPGAPRVVLTYSYDANGNTTRVQDSLGGMTDYSYDPLDRLSRVTQSGSGVQPKRVDMAYNNASLLTQLRRYSDLAGTQGVANTSYEYDCGGCAGRLSAIRHRKASDNSVIHDLTFTRDPLGNILNSTDAEGAHSYTYDPVRRLLSATHPPGGVQPNEFYTYDSVGNRLTSHLSHLYSYSWQTAGKGNRLVQDNQFTYTYDGEGNLTRQEDRVSKVSTEYLYDHRNRLVAAIQKMPSGAETDDSRFTFDALDRRSQTFESGQSVFVYYDRQNPVLRISPTGSVMRRRAYSRSIDGVLADEVSSQTRWYLADQVRTTRDLLSNGAVVLAHYAYETFGKVRRATGQAGRDDFQFQGREYNQAGIGDFRARTYDPNIGRFHSEDSEFPMQYESFAGNPGVFSDPSGRTVAYATIAASAIVAGSGLYGIFQGIDEAKFCSERAYDPIRDPVGGDEARFAECRARLDRILLNEALNIAGAGAALARPWVGLIYVLFNEVFKER